ncbi:MAG TPA: DUF302 domain-containing protein [Candidatus Acidoferrales bacterium]|nr:DUF302 domain-containing protein [Candidatus Acidoferrales bacterium]
MINDIKTSQYSIRKTVSASFEEAVKQVQELLKQEGFGVLTTIDVQQTLEKKLYVAYDKYVILGACHPQSAFKALQMDKDMGLLLPCNVVVYEETKQVIVSAIRPTVALSIANEPALHEVAKEIENKLQRVVEHI